VATVLLVYAPLYRDLVAEWATYPNLSHGFAIPCIAFYLVWQQRQRLAALAPTPSWWGLMVTLPALTLYVAGVRGGESFLARISLPLALVGALLLLGGPRITRTLLPSVTYLIFMVPLPYLPLKQVIDRARLLDASVAAALLPWLGVPVLHDGYLLHLANATLEVAEVCSSLPAIAALLSLGAAYGLIHGRPWRHTLVLLLAAPPLGALANIARIVLTAVGVYHAGPVVLTSLPHTWAGTTVFLATFGLLIALDVCVGSGLERWRSAGR
jgi:exosortase